MEALFTEATQSLLSFSQMLQNWEDGALQHKWKMIQKKQLQASLS